MIRKAPQCNWSSLISHHMLRANPGSVLTTAYLLLGFASGLVDWVLVLFGLPSVLLLILLGRLKTENTFSHLSAPALMYPHLSISMLLQQNSLMNNDNARLMDRVNSLRLTRLARHGMALSTSVQSFTSVTISTVGYSHR